MDLAQLFLILTCSSLFYISYFLYKEHVNSLARKELKRILMREVIEAEFEKSSSFNRLINNFKLTRKELVYLLVELGLRSKKMEEVHYHIFEKLIDYRKFSKLEIRKILKAYSRFDDDSFNDLRFCIKYLQSLVKQRIYVRSTKNA